jgi:hypothetical protein
MPLDKNEVLDSLFRAYVDLWLWPWRCAAAMGGARPPSVASFWDLRPRRDEALAALGQSVDRFLRSRAFLTTLPYAFRVVNDMTAFSGVTPLAWPNLLLRRKVYP